MGWDLPPPLWGAKAPPPGGSFPCENLALLLSECLCAGHCSRYFSQLTCAISQPPREVWTIIIPIFTGEKVESQTTVTQQEAAEWLQSLCP